MATLYEWTDTDNDKCCVLVPPPSFGIALLEINGPPGVYLSRIQAKELRKVLKRALASGLS